MDRAEYLMRMKTARQFSGLGIEPKWVPESGDIEGFIHDEVIRQYHDPRVENDGGIRIRWMKAAWEYATGQAFDGVLPSVDDILRIGAMVEPKVNSPIGFRVMNVYIGDSKGAPPGLIPPMVTSLVQRVADIEPRQGNPGPGATDYRSLWRMDDADRLFAEMVQEAETADDWYLAFEAIHPFGDGNGRSGKILHNWLMGTLGEPVLVSDYFGGGNP